MSLTEVTGDLFAVTGLDALAHGVNCRGIMGAGMTCGPLSRGDRESSRSWW